MVYTKKGKTKYNYGRYTPKRYRQYEQHGKILRYFGGRYGVKLTNPARLPSTMGSGFPISKIVKLRYVEGNAMSINSTGAVDVQNFLCNGLYDPNYTGTGHQPLGFDQWAALYNKYIVLGAKMHLSVIAGSTTNELAPVCVAVKITDDGTPPTSMNAMIEQKVGRYLIFNQQAGANTKTLTIPFSSKKFFGYKDTKDNLARYGANVTADPDELAYFTIMVGTVGGLSMASSRPITFNIVIDYIVQFSEPKDLPPS